MNLLARLADRPIRAIADGVAIARREVREALADLSRWTTTWRAMETIPAVLIAVAITVIIGLVVYCLIGAWSTPHAGRNALETIGL